VNIPFRRVALGLALSCALGTTALAQNTAEQRAMAQDIATVESFGVKQLKSLVPGSEVAFNLNGVPGASVLLRIAGATGEVPMTEGRPGVYTGDYTLRLRDRVTAASLVTAQITKDGQSFTLPMDQSMVLGARSPAPAAAAHITRFNVTAPEGARPGDELVFSLTGAPAGQARAVVQGVPAGIALAETQPGVYEGRYTLRRGDRLDRNLVATGYLMLNRKETSQRFDNRLSDGGNPARATCADCGVVESVRVVEVRGDKPNVLGTIAGGVLGGVLGHQMGGGSGKDLATIAGAVGGAYAGNRIENSRDVSKLHRVVVRMDSGASRSIDLAADPDLKTGAAVRIESGGIVRL
jgi:outer membrane lipoprotein SlyB